MGNEKSVRFNINEFDQTLSPNDHLLLEKILDHAGELEKLFAKIKAGRYRSLAYTHLESGILWASRELHAPVIGGAAV